MKLRTLAAMTGAAALMVVATLASAADSAPAASPAAAAQPAPAPSAGLERAIFAGGCFWCMEAAFDDVNGVVTATSGYTGGHVANPSYEQVSSGATGHVEAVEVVFDPKKISYEKLLDIFWHNVDPLTADGQFCDIGNEYRSEIFYLTPEQRALAEKSRQEIEASGKLPGKIATQIVAAGPFYPAEEYHQKYAQKNPIRYHFYRSRCGRDARLKEVWGSAPH